MGRCSSLQMWALAGVGLLLHVTTTGVQGLTILEGPMTNVSFPSTKFSRWIGNFTFEDCDNTQAPLVTIDPDHQLCTLSSSDYNNTYVGKIVFVESLFSPKKSNFEGCAYEERYLQAELAGAVGVLEYRARTVGLYSTFHSTGYTPNEGNIPLVTVGKEFADIGTALTERDPSVEGLLIQLSCSSENLNDVWIYTITPITNVIVGGFATYTGVIALQEFKRLGAVQRAGRSRSAGVRMRMDVLLIEGILMVVVGPLQFLGVSGSATHSVFLGDLAVGNQFKTFFEQQFVGVSFFTSYLLALFWLELRHSNKEMRSMKYAPGNHKVSVAIVFVLTVIPPLYFAASQAFLYNNPSKSLEGPVFFLLNIIVATFFYVQVSGAMRDLRKVIGTSEAKAKSSKGVGSASTNKTANLVRHMGKWMKLYGVFVFLQALGLGVFSSMTGTPQGIYLFISSTGTTRIAQSVCKIRGMVVTERKSKNAYRTNIASVTSGNTVATRTSITGTGSNPTSTGGVLQDSQ